jgi:hypothetical protein
MKTIVRRALVALALLALPALAQAGELKLTIDNGRVTLIAQEVPLRQILAEWARIGQTTIVNGDKLTGPPLTLQLVDQPEREVLDVLLRVASGYIVAPRQVAVANASAFDRILIMPTSRPPAMSASAPPPAFNRPPQPQPIQPDMDDEPAEPTMPPGMGQPGNPNANVPMTQPMPGMPTPANPAAPMTAPRPGMLPGPPAGQPNPYGTQPQQPPLPPGVRPPGGGGGDRDR